MTTCTELREKIVNGENSQIEFKRGDSHPADLAKELVAFANSPYGGSVLLGVEDDGTVSGLARDDVEEWVMNVCRDKIRPEIKPFFEVVNGVEDSKAVAIISVNSGYAVHTLWHEGGGKYLIRIGSKSREASLDQLRSLFQQRNSLQPERIPLSGATPADLDMRRLKHYYAVIREKVVPAEKDLSAWLALLVATQVMTEDGVTMGGMLLFGNTPKRFLPQAGIECAAYPGIDNDHDLHDRASLRGSMTALKDDRGALVENGIVEQTIEFVKRNTGRSEHAVDGRLEERDTYPEEIVREIVVNALIHRDYNLYGRVIELVVYSDSLEIISPGLLVNGITVERIREGVRSARNLMLKDFMGDYGYVEHMGLGISRKVVNGMKEHNGTSIEMEEQGEGFAVRLFANA